MVALIDLVPSLSGLLQYFIEKTLLRKLISSKIMEHLKRIAVTGIYKDRIEDDIHHCHNNCLPSKESRKNLQKSLNEKSSSKFSDLIGFD